jgi:ParB family chromosome partitioning protein
MAKRQALGRGLSALIPDTGDALPVNGKDDHESAPAGHSVLDLPIDAIEPNPHQPRERFDEASVGELADSIKQKGLLQPINVRRWGTGYQLIAGERRLRASRIAGLTEIPALVVNVTSDEEMMELSLIENIQRENLNPIEEARAYRSLVEECFLTQEEVAERVSKNRSTITNTLRLLSLPDGVRDALEAGEISMGHARALLGLEDDDARIVLCRDIIAKGLSVRRVETLVKEARDGHRPSQPKVRKAAKDPLVADAEDQLRRHLGTAVHINQKGKVGRIEIEFYSTDDLNRILELLE